MRSRGQLMRLGTVLAALVALLGASATLQLLSGGIRVRALGPAVLAVLLALLGAILLDHRPRLRLGMVLLVNGLGFAVAALAASILDYASVHPVPEVVAHASFMVVCFSRTLIIAWVLFILWFPDDHFFTRAWRRYFVASVFLCVTVSVAVWIAGPADRAFDFFQRTTVPAGAGGPFAGTMPALGRASDVLLLLPLVALASLIQRLRHGNPVVRQQVRWLLVALSVEVLAQIVGAALTSQGGALEDVGTALSIASQPLPVIAATVAILRYRLWDFDIVVSRAMVYGVLWFFVSALLLVPALAAGLIVGGRGALAAVGIALLVTVLFQPTRHRLERLVRRLVFRHRVPPHELLTGFWEALRTVELGQLGQLIAGEVHRGLAVRWAAVWRYAGAADGGSLEPLGASGIAEGQPLPVSSAAAVELRGSPGLVMPAVPSLTWPADPAVVVPLVAAEELVGVMACGPRPGDALGTGDFELLELVARQCTLRLRNLLLEADLRHRLTQIEAQADELRRSRQRLVTADDAARRRIERNLHDGVQQQMVALAVRLRRAAADGAPWLAELAADAEQSVFALQEVGRGIFPSVLADQGLSAALRTQVARMPMPVHFEIEPELSGRRFDREVEAALYYVALEALTNTQKHAPDASVGVWLHRGNESYVLDVVDDGPGLRERSCEGTGLQNMADRMAAVGGAFECQSSPHGGTRVTAEIPAHLSGITQPAAAELRR